MEQKDLGKSSTGLQPNVAALLSYLAGWITGLVFFLIEKDNKFVRFHAMQSMIVFGAMTVLQIVLGVFITLLTMIRLTFLIPLVTLVNSLIVLGVFVLWIVLMIKAYQGEKYKLPIVGDLAETNS